MEINYYYGNILERIARKIKELRNERGLTQQDMVNHGFDYRHFVRLESGKYSPSLQTLFKLSQVFQVDIKTFFET